MLEPGKLKCALCPYCYNGIVKLTVDGQYACFPASNGLHSCGRYVLILDAEQKELSTGKHELTSSKLLDHKWEMKKYERGIFK